MTKILLILSTVLLLQGCKALEVFNDTVKTGAEASKTFNEGIALKTTAKAVDKLAETRKIKAETNKARIKNIHNDDKLIALAVSKQPLEAQIPLINRAFKVREQGIQADLEKTKNKFWGGFNWGMLFFLFLLTIGIILKWLLEFFLKLRPIKTEYQR